MNTNQNISEIEKSINQIFECEQKVSNLISQKSQVNAEAILLQHLSKAFGLLDGRK